MSVDITEISAAEMDELIHRINEALDNGLSLEPDDIRLIVQILRQFAWMQGRLEGDQLMKQRYLKLMGLVSSSESHNALFGDSNDDKKKPPRIRKKRHQKKTDALPATVCQHKLEGIEKGQPCPGCEKGRLYKHEPASFIRVTGHAPLQVHKHIMEQLRCRLCGYILTAPLPESVTEDGVRGQKYGFSARALMAIHKFYLGNPYYRQQNLQAMLGVPVSASTVFDQCKLLVDDVMPVFDHMKLLAANARHFHLDDTGNRILNQSAVEKPNRNGKGTRQRTGIYTSALIGTLDGDHPGHQVVLFQTNIGHAGEWIDEILASRDLSLPSPTLMSDALSSNIPADTSCNLSLCNTHARRQFVDIMHLYPQEAEHIIERYALIWQHNTQATADNLDDTQRQLYHNEHSLPVMQEIKTWCEERKSAPDYEDNSALGGAINYYLNHYDRLIAFCHISGAQIDNNLVEMVLKLIALGRKNALFYKTPEGAQVGDVMTSLIATCELGGINIFHYLTALQKNRWQAGRHSEAWLPWNYQLQLTEEEPAAA